jgi:hypothetical protein
MKHGKDKNSKKKRRMAITLVIIIATTGIGVVILTNYLIYNNAETPVFVLPIKDLSVVTGVQVFHDNGSVSKDHHGFDFTVENDTEIFSPIAGKITDVEKKKMFNDLWIVDVIIRVNAKWSMYIAFEPDTYDESVVDAQILNISVKTGDKVEQNQSLGILNPAPGATFAHIHWNINLHLFFHIESEDVSPYDYCSEAAKVQMVDLCALFGKVPDDT